MGSARIKVEDYAGLSSCVAVYSSNDDYSGTAMTNPTVPSRFTNVTRRPVTIGRHVIIGSGSVVLPGVTIGEGQRSERSASWEEIVTHSVCT